MFDVALAVKIFQTKCVKLRFWHNICQLADINQEYRLNKLINYLVCWFLPLKYRSPLMLLFVFFWYSHTYKTRSLCKALNVFNQFFSLKTFFSYFCACCGLQCNYWSLYKRLQEVFVQLYESHAPCKCLSLSLKKTKLFSYNSVFQISLCFSVNILVFNFDTM